VRNGSPLGGLFCSFAHCDYAHGQERAQMNDRLFRATVAANVMMSAAGGSSWAELFSLPVQSSMVPYVTLGGYRTWEQSTQYDSNTGSPVFNILLNLDKRDGSFSTASPNGKAYWATDATATASTAWVDWNQTNQEYRTLQALGRNNAKNFWIEDVTVSSEGGPFTEQNHGDSKSYFWSGLSEYDGGGDPGWVAGVLSGKNRSDGATSPTVVYDFVRKYGNPYINPGAITGESFLDGLELICDATESKLTGSGILPDAATFEDIDRAGEYLSGLATSITQHAGRMIFANIPKVAVDAGRETSAIGVVPLLGGQMADDVTTLRSAELATKQAIPVITGEMNQFGSELRALSALLAKNADLSKIRDLQLVSQILDRLTECGDAIASTDDALTFGGKAAVKCANAVAQIALDTQINNLENQAAAQDDAIAKADFGGKAAQHARALQEAALALGAASESIDHASADVDGLKKSAQINLAKAIYLASSQSQEEAQYLTSLGALSTSKKKRYDAALHNAQVMADLAKRSIEQRLGVRLSEMRDDLPLVEAPQLWEGKVCTMSGIDYDKLTTNPHNYTDGFIGDYITKLSNVVEGYRIENNFHEGSDVAVVSLRDDVFNVRKDCKIASNNLLLESSSLDVGVWRAVGCQPVVADGATQSAMNCISAVARSDAPYTVYDAQNSGAVGYDIRFGDGKGCAAPLAAGPCGWQANVALLQSVSLAPGAYRLSWYTRETGTAGGAHAGKVLSPDGSTTQLTYGASVPGTAPDWNRVSATFTATTNGTYQVGFSVPDTTIPSYPVTVAAVMLEALPPSSTDLPLLGYERTAETNQIVTAACEDTTGEIFRFSQWQRECVHLCDAGFSNNCTDGPIKCYRQASFGVSQSALANGKLFNYSGFARGNFNYRLDTVSLNFVGSGIRDCSRSTLPSTCNSGGFVTYSFDHTGPFFVRNYDGAEKQAYLFDGHIEQARGLATERYISNPIASADQSLLADYTRKELQGRPLDGNFTVRIWEDDAVNFEAIQDVQVILNYSYWTRFN